MFKLKGNFIHASQPMEHNFLGTDNEAYTAGEVVILSSGRLTKGGVDTDGAQKYITLKAQAAEATAVTPIPVKKITKYDIYETMSSGQIASTAIGSAYTLSTTADSITTTTTKGCFVVIETDGATTSKVKGYFVND